MKIRRIIIPFIILALLFTVGCGKSNQTDEPKFVDNAFITDLSHALEKRWDKSDEYAKVGESDNPDHYKEYVQIELDILSKYENEVFEDSKLKEKALSYINWLKQQDEALAYVNVDYEKYSTLWEEAYNNRTKLISEFVNSYGLTVSDKYQSTLTDLITNAKVVQEKEEDKEKIDALVDSLSFELVENSYGYKTYEAILENTTGKDIKSISFTINLIDEDGVVIETTYDSLSNIKKDQKAKVQFMTDKDFSSLEIEADYVSN